MSNIRAIAVFNTPKIKGKVLFTEDVTKNTVQIDIQLTGLKPGLHGFHVHETGDLSQGCDSLCAHFNPTNKQHGGLYSKERHVGDLGNIIADKNGICEMQLIDSQIKLKGNKYNILGRGLIIHEDPDDLGQGTNEASKINGNAGKRIACAIIGYASKCNKPTTNHPTTK